MQYDFTTKVSRKGQGSSKWEQMYGWNPNVKEGVVPLSVADMEFKMIPEVIAGLKEFLDVAILGYTKSPPSFIDAVQSWCERRYGYKLEKDWLIATPGVVNAFYAAVNAFTKPGEGVVLMRPIYYPMSAAINKNGRKLVNCPLIETDGYYTIDFEKFDALSAAPDVKLLIFCSPHNPVGRVWTKEELEKLAAIAIKNNLIVVSDEIHCDLIMPGYQHTVMATLGKEIENRLITCFAPSKTFNLAGLATSAVVIADAGLRNTYNDTLQVMRSANVNILGYKACEIAYNEGEAWLAELIQVLDANQKLVKSYFEENFPKIKAPLIEGTYLQWLDFRPLGLSDEELERFMHMDAEFFTDEGYVFGPEGSGFERINLAAPTSVIRESVERLGAALKKIYR
ncbi:MAG: pyridoxal phosphate-dependent aminotransferase [Fusobacteriaceae bacterium]|jgi:aminotransferase/cystathionine beta-lyase|nr:pyridoxal phosphate-dependent aminotransferase [Fusobacteriaceae bacterium]